MIFKRIISLLLLVSIGIPIAKPLFQSLNNQAFSEDFQFNNNGNQISVTDIIWELADTEGEEEDDSENELEKVLTQAGFLQNLFKHTDKDKRSLPTPISLSSFGDKLYLFHRKILI